MPVVTAQIEQALQAFIDPHSGVDLVTAGAVDKILIDGATVHIKIKLGYPAATVKAQLEEQIRELLQGIDGVTGAQVELTWKVVSAAQQPDERALQKVSNIIAVASGKGGVGKSTTSVNLALALAREGARVGLLDADIYGPSQQLMLGVGAEQRPEQEGQKYLMPIIAHGIKTMSMGYLVTDKTPMVWRGPMAGGALQQLLTQTWWDELDYLIIDMPPGTGDIQLTLAQKAAVAGAVIVTTPQDIALLDAQKGIEMFRKVEVPVLGIVENMAIHICSQCGHKEPIFGEGGGDRIARDYGVPLLGALPLSLSIRQQVDAGKPSVVADPDGEAAQLYGQIARNMAARLDRIAAGQAQAVPIISMSDD